MKNFRLLLILLLSFNYVNCGKSCEGGNEVYSGSLAGCQKNCATKNIQFKCIPREGCVCDEGYIRASSLNQTCILLESCESKGHNYSIKHRLISVSILACPDNEELSCGNPFCQKSCDNLNEPCLIAIFRCEERCYCNEGYVRKTGEGPCVPIESCGN